ncbi:MAG TPA: helix-turn-helix domain-containing protein [Streptosporangiaceae bacterium]|jgi:DNA-binding HxlR family transcriptional regulator
MTLPREYLGQDCPIARALEIIGERWTLLIVRDAFYGVSRFSDFRDHLGIPRAVLTDRLNLLTGQGILARVTAASGRDEYSLTAKGRRLWPTVWSLNSWGNEFYGSDRPCRTYAHNGCGGTLAADGRCGSCGVIPGPAELTVLPWPDAPATSKPDLVSQALSVPHKLLTPIAEVAAS